MPEHLGRALADRYRIERELGAGGMATVYLAQDLKHDRKVALKVLKPELSAILGAERFLAEIKTTANLQHPHILPLHDSGEAVGMVFYVMPYVEGESLRERLARTKQMPVDDAVRIAREVADALEYAHGHGVIHRDIKPENILLQGGHALVADFGIALAASRSEGGTRMTETGMSLGTPHYMSPEQAMGEKEITPAADVYALGCVLYEMLTGEPPFSGATAQAVVAKLLTSEPEPIVTLRKTVPPHVEAAVLTALQKLPADRFARAAEFAAALGDTTAALSRPQPRAVRAASHTSRVTALLPWSIAAIAVILAVVAWVGRRPAPDDRPLRVELEPPPGAEFSEFRFAALSPDGRRMAFVGLAPNGSQQLWIRDLESGRVDSLPSTRGAAAPFWSPTGRSLAFVAQRALWQMELDGSTPQRLCDLADVGGSWSKDNVILLTRNGRPMTVRADGGPCEAVRGPWADSALAITEPAWFPDGRHFAAVSAYHASVMRGSLDGGFPQAFIEGAGDVRFVDPDLVVFTRQGRTGADIVAQRFDPEHLRVLGSSITIAEGVRTAGTVPSYAVTPTALTYLPTARVDEGPLLVDTRGVILDSVVHQGTWTLRFARRRPAVALVGLGVWVHDLERGTTLPVKPSGIYSFPVWGPGDSTLAVMDILTSEGLCAVRLLGLGSGSDTTLSDASGGGSCSYPSDWTPDGRFLVLTRMDSSLAWSAGTPTGGSIWTYDLRTGAFDEELSVDGTASAGVVSPDMRWLAYVSDQTGELQVYVRPFRNSGQPVRVSIAGGALPRWRADGRVLFYQAPNGAIMRVAVTAGATLALGTPELLFHAPRWSARLFADATNGAQKTTTYDVSPDGQRFLIRERSEQTSAAVLLLNWQSLLERPSTER
jgi:serine/threonine-protein kinase